MFGNEQLLATHSICCCCRHAARQCHNDPGPVARSAPPFICTEQRHVPSMKGRGMQVQQLLSAPHSGRRHVRLLEADHVQQVLPGIQRQQGEDLWPLLAPAAHIVRSYLEGWGWGYAALLWPHYLDWAGAPAAPAAGAGEGGCGSTAIGACPCMRRR